MQLEASAARDPSAPATHTRRTPAHDHRHGAAWSGTELKPHPTQRLSPAQSAAAANTVQGDPSQQVEVDLPIDAFAGDHEKQVHADFWQGFDPKDLGEANE